MGIHRCWNLDAWHRRFVTVLAHQQTIRRRGLLQQRRARAGEFRRAES